MTVQDLINYGKKYIHKTQAEMLLAILLNVNTLELFLMLDNKVDEKIISDYKEKILLLKNNEPIQYVVGNVNFYGNIFKVNKNVLIPRFETEELVENTIYYINKYFNDEISVLDIGCGSGAIGLSLKKKLSNVSVTLLDISNDALLVAQDNAKSLQCDVSFLQSDIWDNVVDKYDVIVSNPPYIRDDEEIEDIVKNNEPHLALYGGKDGLDLYRKIREGLLNHVNDKFLLALEIGDLQKNDVVRLFSDLDGVKIITKRDMSSRDRMVFIFRNIELDEDTVL